MKLANIFTAVGGVTKGQAATGSTDTNCLDIKAADSNGIQRDIAQVVRTDSAGTPTVISRRLVSSHKYVTGQCVCTSGNNFNNYSESSAVEWRVELYFMVSSLSASRSLAYNRSNSSYGWDVSVNTNGNIVHTSSYNGNTTTVTWTNWTISPGTWYTLKIYGYINKSSTVYASVNGSSYVSKAAAYKSYTSTARNLTLGASNVSLRGAVVVKGIDWSALTTQRTLSVNIENGTVGSALNLTGGYTLTGPTVQQANQWTT